MKNRFTEMRNERERDYMKSDKGSVEGQLDIFEAMNRAAAAVDRMVEEETQGKKVAGKKSDKKQSEPQAENESAASEETLIAEPVESKKMEMIRGEDMHASLQKTFINTETDDFAMIAYIDYNMVYLKDWNSPASLRVFKDSKEAVNYYMDHLEEIRSGEMATVTEENEPFCDMKYVVENLYTECE